MEKSEKVQKAFENALQFGDSEEVSDGLKADFGITSQYISWDEFDVTSGPPDATPRFSLANVLISGAEVDSEAKSTGRKAFVLSDDGNGCHVFFAYDEKTLAETILATAAKMEDSCNA